MEGDASTKFIHVHVPRVCCCGQHDLLLIFGQDALQRVISLHSDVRYSGNGMQGMASMHRLRCCVAERI